MSQSGDTSISSQVRVGCDVQCVADVRRALDDHGQRYLDRIYTGREQELCGGRDESLAGRFAAKEAILKLLGSTDGLALSDIEIDADDAGRPVARLRGEARDAAGRAGLDGIDVSISHSGEFAFAVAVTIAAQER